MKRILKVLTYIAAGLYLLVDAIFMTIAKPIADWIARHVALRRLRDWIKSLPPYPSLALFSVPVIVLEPNIEETVRSAVSRTPAGSFLTLAPAAARDIVTSVRRAIPKEPSEVPLIVLTQPDIRRFVRKLLVPLV